MKEFISGWFESDKVNDLITLIRLPNLLIIVLTQYFVAIFLIGSERPFTYYLFDPDLFFLSFSTVILAAAGYIINDYYDIKIDYLNKPEKVVVGDVLKRRIALALHWMLNITGVAIGLIVNLFIGAINFVAAFLLWFYSNQLKRMPFLGNFTVAFLTALSLLVVLVIYPENHILVVIYAIFAFFLNLIREIIKDLEDWRGDSAFGCRTLPIIWGLRKTKRILYILLVIFVILLIWLTLKLDNYFIKVYFVLLTIPAGIFVLKLVKADSKMDFYYLSRFSKIIMLTGILSMIFFKFFGNISVNI